VSVDEAIAPADATCQRYLDALAAEFGDKVLGAEINKTDAIIRVDPWVWVEVFRFAKTSLDLPFFCFLSGLDWLESKDQTTRYENVWGSVEEEAAADDTAAPAEIAAEIPAETDPAEASAEVEATAEVAVEAPAGHKTGRAGGDTRFQVFARVSSPTVHRGLIIKADLDETDPRIPTISKVYAGANWHERETWEMFGYWFDGHPNMIHIYLPGGFEGYPMRKDFPLLAREVKPWPGLTNVEPIAGELETAETTEGESA
jgi:NADH-quinone oxidoreductase subunit C